MATLPLFTRALISGASSSSSRALPSALRRLASNDAKQTEAHPPGTEGTTAQIDEAAHAAGGKPVIELSKPPSQTSILAASALGEDWNDERYRAKSTRGGQYSQSSIEKRRKQTTRALGVGGLAALAYLFYHLGRPWEDEYERQKIAGDQVDAGYGQRAWLRLRDSFDFFNKPAWDPLLPPPLPPPHQRPYTLVVDLDDLLVHSVWDVRRRDLLQKALCRQSVQRQHGWRTAKRPGVDYFLSYLSQFYEIVIFTSQPSYTALPIIERLDPMSIYVPYKLFRDCTRWVGSDLVKDLNYLGRDLSKVLILDTEAPCFKLHPHNGVLVPKWDGNPGDKGLIGMIPFLEAVAILGVPDVRLVLKKYADQGRSHEVYKAFGEEQARIKAQSLAEWEAGEGQRQKSLVSGGMGRWFGARNPAASSTTDGPPPTLLERERQRAQEHWKQESQYFKDNAEILQKQMDEDRERQLKEMKTSLVGFLSGNVQPGKARDEGTAAPNV